MITFIITSATLLKKDSNSNDKPFFKTYWKEIICVIGVVSFWGCGFYSSFVWMSYFMTSPSLIDKGSSNAEVVPHAWIINFCMSCLLVIVLPIGGIMGDCVENSLTYTVTSKYTETNAIEINPFFDKDSSVLAVETVLPISGKYALKRDIGYQYVMILGLFIAICSTVPAFGLICTRTVTGAILGQSILVLSLGLFGGNLPVFLVSQFDRDFRYSGIGVSYNFAHALFSGTAPLIQTALVLSSSNAKNNSLNSNKFSLDLMNDSRLRPAYYITSVAILSLVSLNYGIPYCARQKQLEFLAHQQQDDKLSEHLPSAPISFIDTSCHEVFSTKSDNRAEMSPKDNMQVDISIYVNSPRFNKDIAHEYDTK